MKQNTFALSVILMLSTAGCMSDLTRQPKIPCCNTAWAAINCEKLMAAHSSPTLDREVLGDKLVAEVFSCRTRKADAERAKKQEDADTALLERYEQDRQIAERNAILEKEALARETDLQRLIRKDREKAAEEAELLEISTRSEREPECIALKHERKSKVEQCALHVDAYCHSVFVGNASCGQRNRCYKPANSNYVECEIETTCAEIWKTVCSKPLPKGVAVETLDGSSGMCSLAGEKQGAEKVVNLPGGKCTVENTGHWVHPPHIPKGGTRPTRSTIDL